MLTQPLSFLTSIIVNAAFAVFHVHKPSCLLSTWAILYFEGKHSTNLFHKLLPILYKDISHTLNQKQFPLHVTEGKIYQKYFTSFANSVQ